MKPLYLITLAVALMYSAAANAADTPDLTILNTVTQAMAVAATNSIGPMALGSLAAFMSLQFVITNIGLIKSGAELPEVFAKLGGFLFAGAISVTLLNQGPDFIDSVGHGIFGKFLQNAPSAGSIITATLGICTTLVAAIFAIGVVNGAIGNLLVSLALLVFATGMYMSLKVFMLYLELGMVVLLSPLSFSFLGLSALKDQGIAPLKSLISLAYRAILLGVIYSAFGEVVNVAGENLDKINWLNPVMWPSAVNTVFAMFCAFPVIAYLAFKSDSIAANLSSGSTSMGPGDVAGAAAAGAAAGAAVASGGAATMGAATKPVQSMANVMSQMRSGGSVANASSSGSGGMPGSTSALPMSPSLASMGSGSGTGSSTGGAAAAAPTFKTNKAGAPMNPNPNAQIAGPARSGYGSNAGSSSSPGASTGAGSGASAGIGGGGSEVDQNKTSASDRLAGAGKTWKDHLSTLNHHIAQEKAHTSVSINTHHAD